MTVTFEEFQTVNPGGSASGSVTLATTLVSSDLVVAAYSRTSGSAGTFSIGGSPPTFLQEWTNSGVVAQVYTATGLTGSHSLSYTMGAGTANALLVWVVRGLTNSSITAVAESTWTTAFTTINTDEFTTTVAVDTGQAIIAIGCQSGAATPTFPSNPTPSSGWTTDVALTNGRLGGAHRVFTAAEPSARMGVRASSSIRIAASMLVLGDPVGAPPLTSTFVGWGNPIF